MESVGHVEHEIRPPPHALKSYPVTGRNGQALIEIGLIGRQHDIQHIGAWITSMYNEAHDSMWADQVQRHLAVPFPALYGTWQHHREVGLAEAAVSWVVRLHAM